VLSRYSSIGKKLKRAANALLWDPQAGLFRDNETTALMPQDGNAWAVRAGLTNSLSQSLNISSNLRKRWTPFGAPAPEVGGIVPTISPFATSFELQAHILAGATSSALDLMRLQWGFMLDDPQMTNSTLIEGYSADGSLHYTPYAFDARVSVSSMPHAQRHIVLTFSWYSTRMDGRLVRPGFFHYTSRDYELSEAGVHHGSLSLIPAISLMLRLVL
jgi:hypothetical protein